MTGGDHINDEPSHKTCLVILGTSLFVPEVTDLAEETGQYVVRAFIENRDREKTRQPFLGRPVIWIDEAAPLAASHQAVCGLGTTQRKDFIERVASVGFRFARITHPGARISSTSSVGDGSLLSVGVIVASHSRLGRHVIVNRGVLIGHHTTVHDYVTISPGANVAGAVTIGEGACIGMGAIVLDRVTIGAHAVVGAGSVVTRDVPDRVQVMGVPARVTREHVYGR
jgi:sugar O-acyltransferase (sialic acid O-acetyltransferase NeuD family)